MNIELNKAIEDMIEIFSAEKLLLEKNFASLEMSNSDNYFGVTGTRDNCSTVQLRAIPDNERRNPKLPQNSMDYQTQGGHAELQRKFKSQSAVAWKVEVLHKNGGTNYETSFSGSDRNWDKDSFRAQFRSTFGSKT
jgi:hypothetical protein